MGRHRLGETGNPAPLHEMGVDDQTVQHPEAVGRGDVALLEALGPVAVENHGMAHGRRPGAGAGQGDARGVALPNRGQQRRIAENADQPLLIAAGEKDQLRRRNRFPMGGQLRFVPPPHVHQIDPVGPQGQKSGSVFLVHLHGIARSGRNDCHPLGIVQISGFRQNVPRFPLVFGPADQYDGPGFPVRKFHWFAVFAWSRGAASEVQPVFLRTIFVGPIPFD